MYIWVVLATFMVAIFSFNLSHRADMKELLTIPQVEAIVGKMVAQHQAAERYVDVRKPKSREESVSFFPGELQLKRDLETYLPYGFGNVHSGTMTAEEEVDGNFKTLIYCLDKNDANLSKQAAGCGGAGLESCCASADSQAFLVTFGCIPRKWRNVRNNKPKAEFFRGLRNVSVNGTEVGYTEFLDNDEISSQDNIYNSDIALRSRNINLVSIPQFIAEKRLPGASASFSEVCGNESVDEEGEMKQGACDKCLAYISPITF